MALCDAAIGAKVETGLGTPVSEDSSIVGRESSMFATVTRHLQAHTEAIAAQMQIAAAQHLPPLKAFSGEGKQIEEGGFKRWI